MYSFILDALIVCLFIWSFVSGIKYGIIRSLISLIGSALSFVSSIYISGIISSVLYSGFVKDMVRSQVRSMINNGTENFNRTVNGFPGFISNSLDFYGINVDRVNGIINKEGIGAEDILLELFSPVVVNILQAFISIILFCVFMTLVGIIVRGIYKIFRLPVLKEMDKLFGGLFGGLKGYILVMAVTAFTRVTLPAIENRPEILSYESINSSCIFKYFYNNNPAYKMFEEFGK